MAWWVTFRIIRIKRPGITFGMRGHEAIGWPCPYCATVMSTRHYDRTPTTDHVIPRSRVGKRKQIVSRDAIMEATDVAA